MKANIILENIITFWPSEIDISDCIKEKETDGFKSDNLSSAWDYAERKAEGNDWYELGVWIMFTLLHKESRNVFDAKDNLKIYPTKITTEEFRKAYHLALMNETYEEMLLEYLMEN